MMGILIVFHAIICVLLIIIILIQAGRGGGLVEGFSGVESMFGPKTSTFLTKVTSIFSALFLISCVSLAVLSARQSRSLLRNTGVTKTTGQAAVNQTVSEKMEAPLKTSAGNTTQAIPVQELPKQEPPKPEPATTQTVNQEVPTNK